MGDLIFIPGDPTFFPLVEKGWVLLREQMNCEGIMNKAIKLLTQLILLALCIQCEAIGTEMTQDITLNPTNASRTSMPFMKNMGQYDSTIAFCTQTFSGPVFVTHGGKLVYSVAGSGRATQSLEERGMKGEPDGIGAFEPAEAKVSFFHQNAQLRQVESYNYLVFNNLFKHIDLKLHAYGETLEKVFVVKPLGKVGDIQMEFKGVQGLEVNPQGQLLVTVGEGNLVFSKPVAFQEIEGERIPVEVSYWADGLNYGFKVGNYNSDATLIIDPFIVSTLFGGEQVEGSNKVPAMKAPNGDLYVASRSTSATLPLASNGFQPVGSGSADIMVARFSPDLEVLKHVTFLGGSSLEAEWPGVAMAIDSQGAVFVASNTQSSDFPVTANAWDQEKSGMKDGFVAKLSPELDTLLSCTFIGGAMSDDVRAIAIDRDDHVYVSGISSSTDIPTTEGAFGATYSGGTFFGGDVFICKLDNQLETILAATYLGGSKDDYPEALAFNSQNELLLTGWTMSNNFPTSENAFQPNYGGGQYDAFVSKMDASLSTLLASSFVGGTGMDFCYDLFVAQDQSVLVTGHSSSSNYPITSNAFQTTYNLGVSGAEVDDVVVTRLDPNLGQLIASTYLGGQKWENGHTVCEDSEGHIWVAGASSSTDFTVTEDAYQPTSQGGELRFTTEGILAKLSADLSELIYATYLGGTGNDALCNLAYHSDGSLYVSGFTSAPGFNIPNPGFSDQFSGGKDDFGGDIFIACLSEDQVVEDPDFTGLNVSYLPHFVDEEGIWETSVTLVNAHPDPQSIVVGAYDNLGNFLASTTFQFQPLTALSGSIVDLFPSLANQKGWLKIGSEKKGLDGIMTFTFLPTGGRSSLPIIDDGSLELVLPLIEQTEDWKAGFALTNISDQDHSVMVSLRSLDGTEIENQVLELASKQKVVTMVESFFQAALPPQSFIVVTSETKVTGFALTFGANNAQIVAVPATLH